MELGSGNGSGYPISLDSDSSVESTSTSARAAVPNDLAAAIIAIETELGTNPSGTIADVKTYLQVEHNTNGTHSTITNATLTSPTINTPTINTPTINTPTINTPTFTIGGHSSTPVGMPVQIVHTQISAKDYGTTNSVVDDTIPQISEGNLISGLNTIITPLLATNTLLIDINIMVSQAAGAAQEIVLFVTKNSDTDALAAISTTPTTADYRRTMTLKHSMSAGGTSAITFKVYVAALSGAITINGAGNARYYGGVASSSMTITEILT